MRTKSLTSLAMAALVLAACSDEQEFASIPSGGVLTATVEGASPSTRAGFDAEGAFYWTKGDQLGVTTSANTGIFTALTLSDASSGQTSGTFNGAISGEIGSYAVYPYSASHSISNATLTYNLPASYEYAKVDTDYFTETKGEGNSFNPAMWGSINNGSTQLKHLGGVFCIKIPKMPVATGTLTLTADKAITGNFTATLTDGNPVLVSTATSSSNNEVNITFSNASTDASGVFYVPVPTGTYTIRIKMTDSSNATPAKIDAAAGIYVVNRCDLKKVELSEGSIEAEPAESLTAAATDLSSHDNVVVSGEITSTSNEITIPSITSDTEVTKSLALENVASGASLTIKDTEQSGSSNSVDNLVFSIPNNETEDSEPLDLTVTMPNTTVTLAGNGGKAAYGEVTASTAENTLVVSAGVTVNKLTVSKGNIRLKGDAKISEIVNSKEGGAKLYIYVEGKEYGLPSELGDNIEVVDASVADLKAVAAKGGEYTLQSDITGDFVISATEQPVIINLNGHKITNESGDNFIVNIGSTLTINGEGTVDNVSHQKACIYNNGTVNLNGGTYTRSQETGSNPTTGGTNTFYNILNHGDMTIKAGVTVVQNGGYSSLIDNGYYSYTSGNARTGYVEGTNNENPSLTIEGGEFQGGINTIKNDDGATLTINDGTFANTTQATVQNNNVATINGGSFNPTGTAEDALQTRYFEGGKNEGKTTVTGGTLNGNLYFEGTSAKLEVSGGTFSDPSVFEYLGDNANVTMELPGDLTLEKSILIEKGTATIDLQQHTLTAASTATVHVGNADRITAIAVKDGAKAVVKNGQIGNDTDALFYGIYAYGSANVTLENVTFGEMVTYAYNGAGDLTASDCTFKGWLSGWSQGGADFTDCTFTIGKAYYPAAICYGNTTFTNCKFFKNGNDADQLGAQGANDNGYYSYNYVVAIANPATTIDFNNCKFIDESNSETAITVNDHPYHACGDWGDGQLPSESQIQVDGSDIVSQCYSFSQSSSEGGDVTE